MIKETLENNKNNAKHMWSRFMQRAKKNKANVSGRAKATQVRLKKASKLKRKRQALMRLTYEAKKRILDKLAKF